MIKEYVMKRLEAGETVDEIGKEIAARFNEAIAEYEENKKSQERENRKTELLTQLIAVLGEYGELEGMPSEALAVDEKDIKEIAQGIDNYIAILKTLRTPASPAVYRKSNSDILSEFVNSL